MNDDRILSKLLRIEALLYGNGGGPGLDKRVDRIEQALISARWYFRTLIVGVVLLIAERVILN